uniref:Uncharacterized protein n=1 Tax=Amphimedon queenslandica TaxID=400682 RepID=A0A1X7SJX7_AMPQE
LMHRYTTVRGIGDWSRERITTTLTIRVCVKYIHSHAFSLTLCYFNGGRAESTVHFCGTIVLVWKLNTDR